MPKKLFDLHIEVGEMPNGEIYAITRLNNNNTMFMEISQFYADAICEMVCSMDAAGMFQRMKQYPAISQFPFGGQNSTTSAGPSSPKPKYPTGPNNATNNGSPRKSWSDLISVPKGQCEDQCIVYDNFAGKKCGSFCSHKK